jgi:replicative DNA helicase
MVLDPATIPEVLEVLPNDGYFADQQHRIIWRLILSLNERNAGKGVDGLLLRNDIELCPQLGADGVKYLEQMLNTVPTASNAVYYARVVRENAVRRNLIDAGSQIAALAQDEGNATTLADRAQTILGKACEAASYQEQTMDCFSALQAAFKDLEARTQPKLLAVYRDLAQLLPGFMPGQMIVIAGRPAQGKTALALGLVLGNFGAFGGEAKRILFVSLEMTPQDIMQRALSFVSGVPFTRMSGKILTQEDWVRINEAMTVLQRFDFLLVDRPAPFASVVRNTARRLHRRKPLDAVIVDYVQRMRTPDKRATRDWEMTVISNDLKNLALELNIPVIVVSQLNRDCERREDHRPRLSDLRDSGSIEQDADVVLCVYREDAYHRGEAGYEPTNTAEIIIAKQRNGPEGVAHLIFLPDTMAFQNEARGNLE